MPSWELFEEQDEAYRDSVLPPSGHRARRGRAGAAIGWDRYVGPRGAIIGMHTLRRLGAAQGPA